MSAVRKGGIAQTFRRTPGWPFRAAISEVPVPVFRGIYGRENAIRGSAEVDQYKNKNKNH